MNLVSFKNKYKKRIIRERVLGCEEEHGSDDLIYFKSECECCDVFDVKIYMRVGCEMCVNKSLNNLYCGGHFRSLVIFKNNIQISSEGMEFEKSKERYRNIIIEKTEEMSLKELKKILKKTQSLEEQRDET